MMIAPLAAAFFLPVRAPGQPDGLRAGVHRTVRRSGRGQRLDVPDDPDHLSHAARARVKDPSDKDALEAARRVGATEGAATLGFSSAVAAIGLAFIPIAYGTSINLTGSPSLR